MGGVFHVGQSILFLSPHKGSAAGNAGPTVYWQVEDAISSYHKLLEAGAVSCSEASTASGRQLASVNDSFGNILGMESKVDASQKTVEQKPSDTARGVAFLRALAVLDEREEIRGHDHLLNPPVSPLFSE